MNYDFSALNDKDLEALVHDILIKKLNIDFQSFKIGIDKGIDLRYATCNDENEIIVQVKHLEISGISKLKSNLQKYELKKVIEVNPKRYILATTVALNPQNKEDIKLVFKPYILSTNDIIGKNDLTSFLRNNPDIVEKHFKLWLSSTQVLKRIINNGIKGRSEFTEKNIKKRIKLFVPNKTYKSAVELLNKNHFLMITGSPGIGKTTLANFLTCQLLADDFELVYVREVREAEDLYLTGKKQVFYFDDFLGTIALDLKSSRNADAAIAQFVERVLGDKQKRLLLTCRTIILNQAKEESERISNSKFDISKHEIKIEDYTDLDKARILYNHVYFSKLPEDLKGTFFKEKFYWKIIKHKFYNPRTIELFTDPDHLQPNVEYNKEVMDLLNDPTKIWDKPFYVQISFEARLFLSTLYSISGIYSVNEERLKEAFEARLDYEISNNNYQIRTNTFNKVLRELLGGFINRTINSYSTTEYTFLNPSIEDFLFSHFSNNIEEYISVLKSAISFEPFKGRITANFNKSIKRLDFSSLEINSRLLNVFLERLPYLKSYGTAKEINTVIILIRLFKWNDISEKVINILDKLKLENLGWDDRDNIIEILDYISKNNLLEYFSFSKEEYLLKISYGMTNYFQIQSFSRFISGNKIFGNVIINSRSIKNDYFQSIQQNIDESWKRSIDFFIEQNINLRSISEEKDLLSQINRNKDNAKKMNELINVANSPVIDKYTFENERLLNKIRTINAERESKIQSLINEVSSKNEPLEINRLFNCESSESCDDDIPY
jgi:energy-coupling factor transporter ATP-binding protein EcfA2